MVGLLRATGIHEALIAECDSTGEHRESGWGLKEGLDSDRTQKCMYAWKRGNLGLWGVPS